MFLEIEFRPYLPEYERTHGWFRLELELGGPHYRLVHIVGTDERAVFDGRDFCPGPLSRYWDRCAIRDLVTFLTLMPGDTDPEYFEKYTPEQLDYCATHADALYGAYCDSIEGS